MPFSVDSLRLCTLRANVKESWTRYEPEDLEYSIDNGRESLRMKSIQVAKFGTYCIIHQSNYISTIKKDLDNN